MRLLILTLLLLASPAYPHARFRLNETSDGKVTFKSNTPPRNASTGLKSGPCGNVPRTQTPTIYEAGQEIEVQWEETINHPGYFKVSFSKENDTDWLVLLPRYNDTLNGRIEAGATHKYSATVKLPNLTCEKCTLQLIQVMVDTEPKEGESLPPSSFYYSCSDVKLIKGKQPIDPSPGESPSDETPSTKPEPNNPNEGRSKPAKPIGVQVKQSD
jgi:hypothetical protein